MLDTEARKVFTWSQSFHFLAIAFPQINQNGGLKQSHLSSLMAIGIFHGRRKSDSAPNHSLLMT